MITEKLWRKFMPVGGRGVNSRKTRVDEVPSIDILDLQRNKVFSSGPDIAWTACWYRGEDVTASISYRLETRGYVIEGVRFFYITIDTNCGEKKDFNYVIPVVSTLCNFGGVRWWFVCPLFVNDCVCNRRCRIVYMPPGAEYFGCRKCYELTYESRQRHRDKFYEGFEKPYMILQKARKQLPKKRSHQKIRKLMRQIYQAETLINSFKSSY
jgi:hypothetical protein